MVEPAEVGMTSAGVVAAMCFLALAAIMPLTAVIFLGAGLVAYASWRLFRLAAKL